MAVGREVKVGSGVGFSVRVGKTDGNGVTDGGAVTLMTRAVDVGAIRVGVNGTMARLTSVAVLTGCFDVEIAVAGSLHLDAIWLPNNNHPKIPLPHNPTTSNNANPEMYNHRNDPVVYATIQ